MPWSHIACDVFMAAVRRPLFPSRTVALRFLYNPHSDLTFFSSPQGHRKPCVFITWHWTLFQKPQHHNLATYPQVHLKVIMPWPYGGREVTYGFYSVLGAKQSYGALTTAVRRTCGSCNNREGAVRSPHGLQTVYDLMNRMIAVRLP